MREAIDAVTSYVEREFPGASIMDLRDFDRSAHTWSIQTNGAVLLLTVSFEFLRDTPTDQIEPFLRRWDTPSLLRTEGATSRVLVTRDGVQITGR